MKIYETRSRSLVKTITYRVIIIISNFTIALILTKSFSLAAQVAGYTFIINTLLYFFHERIWNNISWGRAK